MTLEPNKFGKYKKDEVIAAGYQIIEHGHTASQVKEYSNINLTHEQRLKHCIGFICKSEWRGCVPVFDTLLIVQLNSIGKL